MKLLRYGAPGKEKPGLLDEEGVLRDLSGHVTDIAGEALTARWLQRLRAIDHSSLALVDGGQRLGPCVGKVIGIGLNYSDHAAESGMELPEEPVIFLKATSAICGPSDEVVMPKGSEKTDWEVELGVVIGDVARHVSEADAMGYVAGYCIVNDLSERHFQFERSGQWVKGKSCDTFCPLGPWLVTCDEIPDPHSLGMYLEVNGHRYQDGSTAKMLFDVPYLVSYLSQFMTLHPSDVISTGTPPGVGLGQDPAVYLKPGDVMVLAVDGLGTQRQKVVAYPSETGAAEHPD